MLKSLSLQSLFRRKIANIRIPEQTDWHSEIAKKGEKSVPAVKLEAIAFKTVSIKNDGKERLKEARIAMFESPSRKNGITRGNISSA